MGAGKGGEMTIATLLADDPYMTGHFYRWLDRSVLPDEQDTVDRSIAALLIDHPDLLNMRSWPEMRDLAR